jgi:hypothetical protein
MARRDSGKWVARAAATGGGRSYRGQMPTKWYGTLFLIVLLGIVFVVYSRYEDQNPVAATPPAIGTHWYDSLAIDVCGDVQPELGTNPNSVSNPGIHTDGDGVIRIEPTRSADAGNNATLARFVADYPKFALTSSSLTIPGEKVRNNGDKCPKETPDAGKAAKVEIKVWPSSQAPGVNEPYTTTDPSSVKLAPPTGQLITIAFVPAGASIPKPSATTITTMLQAISQAGSTTTSVTAPLSVTTTTAPSAATSTTVAGTSTTVAAPTSTTGGQPSK